MNRSDSSSEEYKRVMALPEWLRKELNYLAFMSPDPVNKAEFYHNIAVTGERILANRQELLKRIEGLAEQQKRDRPPSGPNRNGTSEAVRKAHNRGISEIQAIINRLKGEL